MNRLRQRYLRARGFMKEYDRVRKSFPPNKRYLDTGISKSEAHAREMRMKEGVRT